MDDPRPHERRRAPSLPTAALGAALLTATGAPGSAHADASLDEATVAADTLMAEGAGAFDFRLEAIDDEFVDLTVWVRIDHDGEWATLGESTSATVGSAWLVCEARTRGLPDLDGADLLSDEHGAALSSGEPADILGCEVRAQEPAGGVLREVALEEAMEFFGSEFDPESVFVPSEGAEPSCRVDVTEGWFGDYSECFAECSVMRARSIGATIAGGVSAGGAAWGLALSPKATAAAATLGGLVVGQGIGYGFAASTPVLGGLSIAVTPFAVGATLVIGASAAGGALFYIHRTSGCPGCGTSPGYQGWKEDSGTCWNYRGCYCGQNSGLLMGLNKNTTARCCNEYGVDENGRTAGCLTPGDERPEDPASTDGSTDGGGDQSMPEGMMEPEAPASGSEGMDGGDTHPLDQCRTAADCAQPAVPECWSIQCVGGNDSDGSVPSTCVEICIGCFAEDPSPSDPTVTCGMEGTPTTGGQPGS